MRYSKLRYVFLFFFLIVAMPGWGHALTITSSIDVDLLFPEGSGVVLTSTSSFAEAADSESGQDSLLTIQDSTEVFANTDMANAKAIGSFLMPISSPSVSNVYAEAQIDTQGASSSEFTASSYASAELNHFVFYGNGNSGLSVNYNFNYKALLQGDNETSEIPDTFYAGFNAYIEIYEDPSMAGDPAYKKTIVSAELLDLENGNVNIDNGILDIAIEGIVTGAPYFVRLFAEANASVSYKEAGNPVAATPEPSTLFLAGTGLLVFGFLRRKKQA